MATELQTTMQSSTSSNILAIGASRNIGYFTSLRLLAKGATITFLLRSPTIFDKDVEIQTYVKSGKAHLFKGDALNQADVQQAWDAASKHGAIDTVLFTVGGTPTFHVTKGFTISPPNLVTQCLLNVLCTIPSTSDSQPQPRVVVISSTGLTKTSHDALPLLMKPLYGYLLRAPHEDKVGVEFAVAHCTGWAWNSAQDGEPSDEIMGNGWSERTGLPTPGSLHNVLVVRPAFLTDGDCRGDEFEEEAQASSSKKEKRRSKDGKKEKKPYRVSTEELGGYVISRKDVAHFIAQVVSTPEKWEEYKGKCVSIAY